ncbi:hypothetical protein GII36_01215 [Candidatus Mycosynbacter amalyticus]|uniref:PQ-loop repeat-containing protein n=1 Tax=Candidatus Mycosynbacter amalyticus TaxID=2665156 RepID=A0A857MK06_9BACT|nr:hypothetical protein [Candidatus Mycosynbacter amalyticus]QHN42468.1 hypothetical protein GII36_01215 [Candidatus Mycosynbacter amalyticus]
MLEFFLTSLIILISLYGYIVYGFETMRRALRPRTATWLIWAILSTCVAYLQLKHGAGLGAVVTIVAAGGNYILAGMAWHYGHKNIHPIDILSSLAAVGVLVLWATASDQVTTAFATLAYLFGFLPTFERAWRKPYDEIMTPFVMNMLKYALSLLLIGNYAIETTLYPAILAIFNASFLVMMLSRRKLKKLPKKPIAKKRRTRYS